MSDPLALLILLLGGHVLGDFRTLASLLVALLIGLLLTEVLLPMVGER